MAASLRSARDFPADDHDDHQEQADAVTRVLAWFTSPLRPRGESPGTDASLAPSGSQRRSWRDAHGRFRRPPEQPQQLPEVDDILTLADAADAASIHVGGPVRSRTGRDRTGEVRLTLPPAPCPAADTPFTNELAFPARPLPSPDGNPQRWRRAWRRSQGR
jgi:hypothetical protein